MKTAQINVSAPVYLAAGEYLDGVVLAAPQWVRSGTVTVELSRAEAFERDGYADIVLKDGQPYTWTACCSGTDHNHG